MSTKMEKPWTHNVLGVASLTRTLDGALVLAEVDERGGETCPVRDACEEQLGSLIELVLETLLSDLQDVCDVCHAKEVLHIVKTVRLRVRVRELGIDLGLADVLPRHLEVANEVVVLACVIRNLDDLGEVRGILGLDIRICATGQ